MTKKMLYLGFIVTLIIGAIYWMASTYDAEEMVYHFHNGQFDASDYREGLYDLEGVWQFIPDQIDPSRYYTDVLMREVPHEFQNEKVMDYSPFGQAVYRGTLRGLKPNTIYGLFIFNELTTYELYVNGELTVGNGSIEDNIPEWKNVAIPVSTNASGEMAFVMAIQNYDYNRGGFVTPIKFGNWSDVSMYYTQNNLITISLVAGIMVMGLFFFGYYVMQDQNKVVLHFAVYCVIMSLYTFLTGFRMSKYVLPGLSWNFIVRMEFTMGYMLVPMYLIFVLYLLKLNEKYNKYLYIFPVATTLMCWITSHLVYTKLLDPYRYISMIGLCTMMVVYAILYLKNHHGTKLMLFSGAVLLITNVKEVLFRSRINYVSHGTFVLMICFSYLILDEIVDVYRRNSVLEKRVVIDTMTGIYNRDFLLETIDNFIAKKDKKETYLVLFDTCGLSEINAKSGYSEGDAVLRALVKRLGGLICEKCIIARYGGNVFAVVMENADIEQVYNLVERAKTAMEEPIAVYDRAYELSLSTGFAKYEEGWHREKWLEMADGAMYRAKAYGIG